MKNPEHLQLLPFDGFLGVINDESRLSNTANDQISGSQVDYKIVERRSQVFVRLPGTVMMHKALLMATVDHEMYRGISSSRQPSENGISVGKFAITNILQKTNTSSTEVNSACLITCSNVSVVPSSSISLGYFLGKFSC